MSTRDDRLLELLAGTSRTFALTIPYLPEPTRQAVMIAYLLFRIADTLEDAELWPRERKAEELRAFPKLLREGSGAAAQFSARIQSEPPTAQAAYLKLLDETPLVQGAFDALPAGAREIVLRHLEITAEGMAASALREDKGVLRLTTLPELREYCYFVAGVVGEMLSELFLGDFPALRGVAVALRRGSRPFGEGLQLTNILKDEGDDARDGRVYLPAGTPRPELFGLARDDLAAARSYVETLREGGAPAGVLAFTALPVRLATETLRAIERLGPGARVPREEVLRAVSELNAALEEGAMGALISRWWRAE